MNAIFDIKRFGKFLKTDIYSNYIKLLILPIVLVVVIGLNYFWSKNWLYLNFDADLLNVLLYILIFLIPIPLFYNLYSKTKGLQFSMLPASQFEKVFAGILESAVIVPIIMTVLYYFSMLLIKNISYPNLFFNEFNLIINGIYDAICLQSLVLLGMFWFKGNKIIKMIGTIVAIFALFTIIPMIAVGTGLADYFVSVFYKYLNSDFIRYWIEEEGKRFAELFKIVMHICFPLAPYCLAFWKFRKTQI